MTYDEEFMLLALKEAKKAYKSGDVPVGAVIVKNNKVISKAFNKKQKKQNAIYHAEVLAINKACKKLKSFRLQDCVLYVTLEPCAMCSGAIIGARLKKVFFGAYDLNYGCCVSKYNLLSDACFETVVESDGGILENDCKKMIQEFFKNVRQKNKQKKLK